MKKIYIVGNWKSNKTMSEAIKWLEEIGNNKEKISSEIIVCPPFTLLSSMKQMIEESGLSIAIGAQDISPFPLGAYTGEIAAKQLREYASYVIVGHSERRKYFHEDQAMLANKVDMALEQGMIPIFCFSDVDDIIPESVKLVAYEPVFAIGTGEPDSPEHIAEVAEAIKERNKHITTVLYGGSVGSENIQTILAQENISGVLVGSASLIADSFLQIIKMAEHI